MNLCAHYRDGDTKLREPRANEQFVKLPKICVCDSCGVPMGAIHRDGRVRFNPALTIRQQDRVREFLTGEPAPKREHLEPLLLDVRELGRRGGLLSAAARMTKMTPERRSEVAREAARKRWAKKEP